MKDINELLALPKSDLHNHATRGGNLSDLLSDSENILKTLPKQFFDIDAMQKWYEDKIKIHFLGVEGFIKRVESAFKQFNKSNVEVFSLSFGYGDIRLFKSVDIFIETINNLYKKYTPNAIFIPEIAFERGVDAKIAMKIFNELAKHNFFKSIDLVGNENLGVFEYISLYKKAKKLGFRLRAHVGEYCAPELIVDAVKKLKLDEVQHGITAAKSVDVMEFLEERGTILNICPTSNVMLSNVDDMSIHPIGRIYRFGVKVTINTDDQLIFNSDLNNEYRILFKNGILTLEELDAIRNFGLSIYKKQ